MKTRRKLTAKEIQVAANAKRLWMEHKTTHGKLSQEVAASDLGWSQSAFTQFINGKVALNTEAKLKLAKYFGCQVKKIDPDFEFDVTAPQLTTVGTTLKNDIDEMLVAAVQDDLSKMSDEAIYAALEAAFEKLSPDGRRTALQKLVGKIV